MGKLKNINNTSENKTHKVIVIGLLYILSILIMASGAGFTLYCIWNKTSFVVLNTSVHGMVFGVLVIYLGLRYFLSVKSLKSEVFKQSSNFSWKNFNKNK